MAIFSLLFIKQIMGRRSFPYKEHSNASLFAEKNLKIFSP
jgi:hypothetical protein